MTASGGRFSPPRPASARFRRRAPPTLPGRDEIGDKGVAPVDHARQKDAVFRAMDDDVGGEMPRHKIKPAGEPRLRNLHQPPADFVARPRGVRSRPILHQALSPEAYGLKSRALDPARPEPRTRAASPTISAHYALIAVLVDKLVLADPGHHRAQALADLLDRMGVIARPDGLEGGLVRPCSRASSRA